ncbi:M15 family metallopeptidase [Motiliproteus sp. SC1-56]|uniref:M15 family metallopeptidase n=1 Tax=Motiliproteus sp. SC1-56 TaxID=2799565 RepID=UPI001A8E3D49|nr:M15 family metallopeptidase [Motiliproteus sp. SC1-56]
MKHQAADAIAERPMPDWAAVARIPIRDNHEPLVPCGLSDGRIRVYPAYYQLGVPGALPDCHLREGVYERLLAAAQSLPKGVRLVLLDGWRPFAVQQYLFETLNDILAKQRPELSPSRRLAWARELVAPPSFEADHPSPHLTGGAVDLTLCDEAGRLLPMGSRFDEATARAHTAYFEARTNLSADERVMRDNRRLLYQTMASVGFSNLPSEWWHYDFGDQLWADAHGEAQACYGATRVQTLAQRWSEQLAGGEDLQ